MPVKSKKRKLKAPPKVDVTPKEPDVAAEPENKELPALKERQTFLLEQLELHEKEGWRVSSQLTTELSQLNKRIELIETGQL